MGCCIGTLYLTLIFRKVLLGSLIMLLMGIIWEGLDVMASQGWLVWEFLDVNGFSWGDIARDVVGIALAYPLRRYK